MEKTLFFFFVVLIISVLYVLFNILLWKRCNLWHFFCWPLSQEICCASFYPWKLPFPPRPVGDLPVKPCVPGTAQGGLLLSDFTSTSSENTQWSPLVLSGDQLTPPASSDPLAPCPLLHHFELCPKSSWRSVFPLHLPRSQEVDRVSLVSLHSLKTLWIFASFVT